VVRRRLFDKVDDDVAAQVAHHYHKLYTTLGSLPPQYMDAAYQDLIRRSYPFHPELITVLYERWGAKPGFQLTRGTLRFLALVLQDLCSIARMWPLILFRWGMSRSITAAFGRWSRTSPTTRSGNR